MKVKELMIGNLGIEAYSGEILEVIGITKYSVQFSGEAKGEWRAEPIYITEEWLFRFGFTKGKDKYLSPHKNSENSHWDRMVYDLHEREFIVNSNEYDGWDVPCSFVHQLQNLYFTLTGEKLIPKWT